MLVLITEHGFHPPLKKNSLQNSSKSVVSHSWLLCHYRRIRFSSFIQSAKHYREKQSMLTT